MNAVRGIWRDLIDKGLWPYALVLLVIISAVPVVLARTAGGAGVVGEDAAGVAVASEGPREAVIRAADPGETPSVGKMRNPFYEEPSGGPAGVPSGAGTPGAAAAPAGAAAASEAGSKESDALDERRAVEPGSDSGSTDGPTRGSTDGAKRQSSKGSGESGYDVSLRFGTEDEMKTFTAVPRLTPLPSADSPSFVYLGVLSGGKTAVFMIAVDVTAVGDGTCRPSPTSCETLELKAGQTMFLDVPGEDGAVTQYRLDVTKIQKIGKGGNTVSDEEAGRTATGAGSKAAVAAGRKALRRARKTRARRTLDRYRFVRSRGVVVRRAAPARREGLKIRATGVVVAGGL